MSYETYRRSLTPVVRAVYRLDVRGERNVPQAGRVVVVANHESVLDPFVLSAAVPRTLRYLAKSELWRVPLLHYWLDSVEAISVERGRSDAGAIASAVAALEAGEAVGVFPQGAVRREGPWLRGAARMALAAGAPILPVRLIGTGRAIGRGIVGFPRIAVIIGEPIAVERTLPTVDLARDLIDRAQVAVDRLAT